MLSSVASHKNRRNIHFPFVFLFCLILFTALACGDPDLLFTPSPTGTAQSPSPEGELPAAWSAGDHALSMDYAGLQRTYVVHIPSGFDPSQPTALVLAFHGIGLDADEMMRISGLSARSDAEGFIVVYPEGSGTTKSWNGGHCCGTAARDNVDDVGFVRALIAELSARLPVDPQRIHATGFSNGAIFTYRLMCELPDLIASFAPVSATPAELDLQGCEPGRPVALIHFHGTADTANPYDGGELPSGFYFLPALETVQFWADLDGCDPQPQSTTAGSITHSVYSSCTAGSAVELYTIADGMHAWPGGEAVNAAMGEPTMEIDASAILWEFFLAHPLP